MFELLRNALFFSGGMILISYPSYAASMGLAIGKLFHSHGTRIAFSGLVVILLSLGVTFSVFGFLWTIGVAIAGFILGFLLITFLKSGAQLVGLIFSISGYGYFLFRGFN